MAEEKTPQEGGKSPWAMEPAPFGRTKTGRPRKRQVHNPKGQKPGPRKRKGASTRGLGKKAVVNQADWRRKVLARLVKFDDVQKQVFLDELSQHGRLGTSALAADTTMDTVRKHRDNDPNFDNDVIRAIEEYRDKLVGHHQNLCLEGEITKRYHKGELVEEKHTFPIQLIMMELKYVDPGYRDKQTIDLNQTGGVLVAPADISPADWIARQEELNKTKKNPDEEAEKNKAK